jgi:predicted O-linked N-acetylglucosamine transferase (SPINDLY family)
LAQEAAGRLEEAERTLRRLLQRHPRQGEVWCNLGSLLGRMNRFQEARTALEQALALNGSLPQAWFNLGNLLNRMGFLESSEAALRNTIRLAPQAVDPRNNLARVLTRMGRTREALVCQEEALQLAPGDLSLHSNRLATLLYLPGCSAEWIRSEHAAFGAWLTRQAAETVRPAGTRLAGQRLRMAYLSPDLRDHAVAFFLEPVLRHHDRNRVEVWAYSLVEQCDAVTERMKTEVEHWVEARNLDDAALLRRIQADGIEVLVDLCGHFDGNRVAVMARRPAPLCLSWIGYPGSTGIAGVVRLSDAVMDPEDEDALPGRDPVYRLPNAHAFQPPEPRPRPAAVPALLRGRVTAGCIQNWSKLNPETLELWVPLLLKNPCLDLAFLDAPPEGGTWVLDFFQTCGVPEGRVSLHAKEGHGRFFALLGQVDFLLDTWPYSGTTTTALALWAGVPTLTMKGDRPSSRTSASVLAAAGLQDWIAADPAALLEKVTYWTGHPEGLAALRADLPQRLESSALTDGARMARDLEEACVFLLGLRGSER